MKKIAIMQPYFFPYIGYFKLINAVDCFIFLDDVSFIKQGFIHRNKLLFNSTPTWFTLPLQNASQNVTIQNTKISQENFPKWRRKFLASLHSFYSKSPYYKSGLEIVQATLDEPSLYMGEFAKKSIENCVQYLEIQTQFTSSSQMKTNKDFKAEERILALCKEVNASEYINLSGGKEIYCAKNFSKEGIGLSFLKPEQFEISVNLIQIQDNKSYNPYLSILDLIMCFSKEEIKKLLANTEFDAL